MLNYAGPLNSCYANETELHSLWVGVQDLQKNWVQRRDNWGRLFCSYSVCQRCGMPLELLDEAEKIREVIPVECFQVQQVLCVDKVALNCWTWVGSAGVPIMYHCSFDCFLCRVVILGVIYLIVLFSNINSFTISTKKKKHPAIYMYGQYIDIKSSIPFVNSF